MSIKLGAGAIALSGAIIILLLVNLSIYSKEKLLSEGEIVYLELAPVDPRSLMQGDYMALRFTIGNRIQQLVRKNPRLPDDGRVIVELDAKRIAGFKRLDEGGALQENERRLRYRIRNNQVKFATNAFFFEEGTGNLYRAARYGQFRVADDGEMLLVDLYNADLKRLGTEATQ